ncbi:hypothetical protein ACIBJD_00605 [Kitasatospora sp. NPDC050467]|uniref:hypothetical protein n=1 Tax=Kitasatospora sp. NPDC050467 TaxID=3364053 RepID=UPI00379F0BD8
MVSFKELREADFSGVTETAEAWTSMAKALESLDGRVGRELTNTPQRAGWEGAAADDAGRALQGIDTDFTQASGVATALAAIIRDAGEDFTAARKDLDNALHDASEQKLIVADDGAVSWPPMSSQGHNDPDYQETLRTYQADMKGKAEAMSTRIGQAVAKATAADQRASSSLQSDVGTSTTAFNARPYGGGDAADARRATDLLGKGGSLSDEERKRLQNLMAADSGSKEFSTTLLAGLRAGDKTGPEALLEYSKAYNGYAHGDHDAGDYQDIYGSLSKVLATATKDGGMGKEWEDNLLKAARKPGGSAAGYNEGYPALTQLMGAGGSYDKGFLERVGNDLVDYEKSSKHKGEDLWGPFYTVPGDKSTDPMGGLMRAMSHNPEASKAFLDPAKSGNLDYLLKDRKWPNQDNEAKMFPADLKASSHAAFADVLEAATTGRDPHGNGKPVRPHDEGMVRIMDKTLTTLAGDRAGHENELSPVLRRPLANMISEFPADTHDILSKDLSGPSHPEGLTASREQLLRVIRGVTEDPEAFAVIHLSESREVGRRMDEFGPENFKPDVTGRPNPQFAGFLDESGKALGALDAVRADTFIDHKSDEQFKNNWKAKMDYHVYGTAANMLKIPGASWFPLGDVAQRLVDVGTSDWANKANAELDVRTQGDVSKNYTAGESQLMTMIQEKARRSGVSDQDMTATGSVTKQLADSAGVHYRSSIDRAYHNALGNP